MVASGNDEASGCALLSAPASAGGAGGEQAATNEAAANVQNTERQFIERVALLRAHPARVGILRSKRLGRARRPPAVCTLSEITRIDDRSTPPSRPLRG
jgi:hypothetical protein